MTDISISDIKRINYKDIDVKIDRLSYYINRVNQRINALENFSKYSTEINRKIQAKFDEKSPKTSTIEAKR